MTPGDAATIRPHHWMVAVIGAIVLLAIGFLISTGRSDSGNGLAPLINGIVAARTGIAEAESAEANKYSPEVLRLAQGSLKAAEAEIEIERTQFVLFRSYDRAKALLASAQSEAVKAQQDAVVNKEVARVAAENALTQAVAVVDSANMILMRAPVGRDNRADLEMMKADLAGAGSALAEVRLAIAQEDYFGARVLAESTGEKAEQIVNDVMMARDRMWPGHR